MTRRIAVAVAVASLAACGWRANNPPPANVLVSAGDSTFWVRTDSAGSRVRGAPLLLTNVDGRFYELYVADDDRSYADAVMVGQRIFRRDLVTGDSVVLLDDTPIRAIASEYAVKHPDEAPLGPDDEESDDPSVAASTDTEIIDVLGPFMTYEQHVDIDGVGVTREHTTRRGVLDVRSAQPVALRAMVRDAEVDSILSRASAMLVSARDSVRVSHDVRARRAESTLNGFVFDSQSFSLVESRGSPAIAFFIPGRGARAAGYALPLEPIVIRGGRWWNEVRRTLPTAVPGGDDVWHDDALDVIARYDSAGESAWIVLRRPTRASREWRVARVPSPVRRVFRLRGSPNDSATIRGLTRAFDDAALYSGDARTAAYLPRFRPGTHRPSRDARATHAVSYRQR
jgi:hypothetical protein